MLKDKSFQVIDNGISASEFNLRLQRTASILHGPSTGHHYALIGPYVSGRRPKWAFLPQIDQ